MVDLCGVDSDEPEFVAALRIGCVLHHLADQLHLPWRYAIDDRVDTG